MSVLSQPRFHDEAAAFAYLESMIWANGTVCPQCGVVNGRIYDLSGVRGKPSKKNPEGAIRHGLKKCGECRKQFTAKVGTVFEDAKLPLHKMLQAVHLIVSSKKGISSHQLSRILEIQYNSAWFLSHRIREAMPSDDLAPFGGNGGTVEVDETFIRRVKGAPVKRAFHHKMKVLALVDRDSGKAHTMVVDNVNAATLMPIVIANVAREATIMTDEHKAYTKLADHFAGHGTTTHSAGQYVDLNDRRIHSNIVEGYFSIFKRGYQHCGEQHLHRYLLSLSSVTTTVSGTALMTASERAKHWRASSASASRIAGLTSTPKKAKAPGKVSRPAAHEATSKTPNSDSQKRAAVL